uniref:Uncharacterized protein n=1 Tax=Rhizophora mucronata TaxID=61149 RepID=A0A2P2NVS1_RHIMU
MLKHNPKFKSSGFLSWYVWQISDCSHVHMCSELEDSIATQEIQKR